MFITGNFFLGGGEASILVSHPLHNLGVRTVSPFPESAPWHGTVLRNGALHLYVCHVLVRKSRTEPRRNSKFGGNIPLARVVTPVVFSGRKVKIKIKRAHRIFLNRRRIITDKKCVAEMLTMAFNSADVGFSQRSYAAKRMLGFSKVCVCNGEWLLVNT